MKTNYRNQIIDKNDFGFWFCNIHKNGRYVATVRAHLYGEIKEKIDNALNCEINHILGVDEMTTLN